MSYIALSDFGRNNVVTLGTLTAGAGTLSSLKVTAFVGGGNVISDVSGNLIIGAGGSGGNIIPGADKTILVSDGVSAIWQQLSDGYVSPTAAIQGTKIQSATTGSLGVIKLAQDLGGTALLPSVLKINGATVPTIGVQGNVLQVGPVANTLIYGPVNLSGGANFVVGILPLGAFSPGSANQVLTMSGAGAIQWSLLVNANIQASAAISVSKLANGADQTTLTTVGTTPTWVALGGGGSPVGSGRTINTTLPLTGGGSLANNLTLAINNATAGAVGVIQLAGDLGPTAVSPTVVGLTGTANVVAIHGTTLLWDVSVVSPFITQNTSGASSGSDLAMAAQSAVTTGGNLTLSSGNATTAGEVRLAIGPNKAFVVNSLTKFTLFGSPNPTWTTGNISPTSAEIDGSIYTETGSPNGDLWVRRAGSWVSIMGLAGGSTPTGPAGGIDVTGTFPNALTVIGLTGSGGLTIIRSTSPALQFQNTTTAPILNQANTSSASGQTLTVQAQNTSASGQPGGSLNLTSGTGGAGNFPGSVNLSAGGTAQFSVLTNPSTVLQMVPPFLQWAASTVAPTLTQVNQAAGNANQMTIIAQAATGSGTPAGGLLQLLAGPSSLGTGGSVIISTGTGGSGTSITLRIAATANLTLTQALLQWASGITNPVINQASVGSGTGQTLTVGAQNVTAGGGSGGELALLAGNSTAGVGGSVLLNAGSGSNSSTVGSIIVKAGATSIMTINAVATALSLNFDNAGVPTITQGSTNTANGATFTIAAQQSFLGASTGGSLVLQTGAGISVAGSMLFKVGATTNLTLTQGVLQWASGISGPFINQAAVAGAGQLLTIAAQISSGAAGGSLALSAGDGGTVGGNVVLRSGSGPSAGLILFNIGGIQNLALSQGLLQWNSIITNPLINQASSASGNGNSFGISAQSITGGAGFGGQLVLLGGNSSGGIGGSISLTTGAGSNANNPGQISFGIGGISALSLLKIGAQYNLHFAAIASTPISFGMDPIGGGNPGNIFEITGQDSSGGGGLGGTVNIRSGAGNGGAAQGTLTIQLAAGGAFGSATTLLALSRSSVSGGRVLGFLNTATGTEMPASTGDRVIYVSNATTVPTSGIPVGGGILYVSGGALHWKSSSGVDTTLAP